MRATAEDSGTTVDTPMTPTASAGWYCAATTSTTSSSASTRSAARWRPAATASACCARCSRSRNRPKQPLYWIYNYKRGSFYPFVPAGGAQQRDTERELVLKAQLGGRAADRAGARAVVSAVGNPDLSRRALHLAGARGVPGGARRHARVLSARAAGPHPDGRAVQPRARAGLPCLGPGEGRNRAPDPSVGRDRAGGQDQTGGVRRGQPGRPPLPQLDPRRQLDQVSRPLPRDVRC